MYNSSLLKETRKKCGQLNYQFTGYTVNRSFGFPRKICISTVSVCTFNQNNNQAFIIIYLYE